MKRGLLLFSLFFVFFIISLASCSVYINEVMYDPGDFGGTYNEWIEIYNPSELPINLSGWVLYDKSGTSNKTVNLSGEIKPASYLVITRKNDLFCGIWNCSEIKTLNGTIILDNTADEIWLFNYSQLEDHILYNESNEWPEAENNSLQKLGFSLPNNQTNWCATFPTPGNVNNCTGSQNPTNETLTINVIFPLQVWNNGIEFFVNLSLLNFENATYNLKIDAMDEENPLSNLWNGTSWLGQNRWWYNAFYVNSTNFSLNTRMKVDEDFIGNASLQIKLNNTKTLEIFGPFYYNITIINDTQEDNQEENNQNEDSSIKISDSPSKSKFGKTIDIDLEIYKGSTSKYAVYIYIQDENDNKVSEKKTLHLRTKYQDYEEHASLELDCLNKSGNYKIIAEGLDDKDTESIYLESCFTKETSQSSSISIPSNTQNNPSQQNQEIDSTYLSTQTNPITGSAISSSESNSPLFLTILPIILGFIIILLIVTLIYKKL